MDDDQHDNRSDQAKRVPPLFSTLDTIRKDDVEGIFPDLLCQFERHAMLGKN